MLLAMGFSGTSSTCGLIARPRLWPPQGSLRWLSLSTLVTRKDFTFRYRYCPFLYLLSPRDRKHDSSKTLAKQEDCYSNHNGHALAVCAARAAARDAALITALPSKVVLLVGPSSLIPLNIYGSDLMLTACLRLFCLQILRF